MSKEEEVVNKPFTIPGTTVASIKLKTSPEKHNETKKRKSPDAIIIPQFKVRKQTMYDILEATKSSDGTFNFGVKTFETNQKIKPGRFVRRLLRRPPDNEEKFNLTDFINNLISKGRDHGSRVKVTGFETSISRKLSSPQKNKDQSPNTTETTPNNIIPLETNGDISMDETSEVGLNNSMDLDVSLIDTENNNLVRNNNTRTGNFTQFPCIHGSVIAIDANSTIYVHGIMSIKVVYGSVDILGYHLDATTPTHNVDSPLDCAYLSLRNLNTRDNTSEKNFRKKLLNVGVSECIADQLVASHMKLEGLIVFCKMEDEVANKPFTIIVGINVVSIKLKTSPEKHNETKENKSPTALIKPTFKPKKTLRVRKYSPFSTQFRVQENHDVLESTQTNDGAFAFGKCTTITANQEIKPGRFVRRLLCSAPDNEERFDLTEFINKLISRGRDNGSQMKVVGFETSISRELSKPPKNKVQCPNTTETTQSNTILPDTNDDISMDKTSEVGLNVGMDLNESFIDIKNNHLLRNNETPTGNYMQFPCIDGSVIAIDANSTIYIHGIMGIKVIYGSVDILGYHLDAKTPTYKVYSPRGSAFLSLRNLNTRDNTSEKRFREKLLNVGVSECNTDQLVASHMQPKCLILFCKMVSNHRIEFLEANCEQSLYPPKQNGLRAVFQNYIGNSCVYKPHERWNEIVSATRDDSVIMLCGGKGVGKSTLLRYLINALLGSFEGVLVVDLDPGQPEFTVSGCISLTYVNEPVFGPNYTHLKKPERSIFVPQIDISVNHSAYLDCVKVLLNDFCTLTTKPTIVNYMGYSEQLGLNMAASVISLVQPTMVVQLQSVHISRNFEADLTAPNVFIHKNLLTPDVRTSCRYDFLKIESMTRNEGAWELESRQMRELLTLAYISGTLPSGCLFLTQREVKICRTPLDAVKLICNDVEVEPMTINACLVALCSFKTRQYDQTIYNCLGWGLVRAVNPVCKFLDLLTPAGIGVLNNTTHLVLGSVGVPPAIYLRQDTRIKGHVPYTSKGRISTF